MLFERPMLLLLESALLWFCVLGGRHEFPAMSPPILKEDDTMENHLNTPPYYLYCKASGQPEPTITVLSDEAPIDVKRYSLETSEYDTVRMKFDVPEGVYQCVANNSHGVARSDDITMKHVGVRMAYTLLPGGHGVVTCDAVVDVKHLSPTYTWEKDTERVSVSDRHYIDVNGSLHILDMGPFDAGEYFCTINITENKKHTNKTRKTLVRWSTSFPNSTTQNPAAANNSSQRPSTHSPEFHKSSTIPIQTPGSDIPGVNTYSTTLTQTPGSHTPGIHTSSTIPAQTPGSHSPGMNTYSTTPTQTPGSHSLEITTSSAIPTQTPGSNIPAMHSSAIKPTQTAVVHSTVHYTTYSTNQHTWAWPQTSTSWENTAGSTVEDTTMRQTYSSLPSTSSTRTTQRKQNRGPHTIMLTTQRRYTYGNNMTIECLCSELQNNKHPNISWTVPDIVKRKIDIRSDKYQRRLVIRNVSHDAAGTYNCSCQNSSIKSIDIIIHAEYMWVTKPTPVVVLAGDTASFICDAQWSDKEPRNRTITWYSNYSRIQNETGPLIKFQNVRRNRDIRNIQCRTESEHRSLYFNSYLQVIERMVLSADRTNFSIDADSVSISLAARFIADPYAEISTSWEQIPENSNSSEKLYIQTPNLIRYTDSNTTWEMLLGTYNFTVKNKYEQETISFYVSRKSRESLTGPVSAVRYYLGEILGLVTAVAVLLILCILYKEREWLKKKWRKRKLEQSMKFRLELAKYNHASRYVKFPAHSDEFPIDRLHFLDTLGAGNFGTVMKAEALDVSGTGKWDLVAVKMCKDIATDAEKENLYHETVIMRKIPPHINVVTYLSYVASSEPSLLIMEYVPGGNLLQFLRNRRPQKVKDEEEVTGERTSGERDDAREDKEEQKSEGNTVPEQMNILSSRDLSSFALQIAKGMSHIASQNIIHRDLAARNVLLGLGNVCKISDFGLSRDMEGSDEYEVSTMGPLPIRWMPPESLTDRLYTLKSDVWSYGVLLWEIVTLGASPYSGQSARQVMLSVKDGKRLEKPDYCSDHVYKLMTHCWRTHPGDRPTFCKLTETIEQHLEEEAEYVQLSNFDVNIYDVIDMGGMDVMEEKV